MPFVYRGVQKSYLEGEAYNALYRSGFADERHGTRPACLAVFASVGLPVGTEIAVEKIYRMSRGYEPNAPFRSGDVAEYWLYRLTDEATWYDPKTGKPRPNKWTLTDHGVRLHSGELFSPSRKEAEREALYQRRRW